MKIENIDEFDKQAILIALETAMVCCTKYAEEFRTMDIPDTAMQTSIGRYKRAHRKVRGAA